MFLQRDCPAQLGPAQSSGAGSARSCHCHGEARTSCATVELGPREPRATVRHGSAQLNPPARALQDRTIVVVELGQARATVELGLVKAVPGRPQRECPTQLGPARPFGAASARPRYCRGGAGANCATVDLGPRRAPPRQASAQLSGVTWPSATLRRGFCKTPPSPWWIWGKPRHSGAGASRYDGWRHRPSVTATVVRPWVPQSSRYRLASCTL